MSPEEFSDRFDVLYNNITSNRAPGLNEYEKSVFLTKGQSEILLSYVTPKGNKYQEGYDESGRRQIDFSKLTVVINYNEIKVLISENTSPANPRVLSFSEVFKLWSKNKVTHESSAQYIKQQGEKADADYSVIIDSYNGPNYTNPRYATLKHIWKQALYDLRDNSKAVVIPSDIMSILNETVTVERKGYTKRLVVVPIDYSEYNRLMSKPFKRPIKEQAWRLINTSIEGRTSNDIIVGPGDEIKSYEIRYIKKPTPIITYDLEDGLEIDGVSEQSECILDPLIHEDILQRAVELAKAAYTGDLQSQIALGQTSHTNIGVVVPQDNK